MDVSKFNFKNHVWKLSPEGAEGAEALLLLHGFPSEAFNSTPQEKNQDLGIYLATNLKKDAYIHHYNGLGKNKNGDFNFIESIQDTFELIDLLLTQYQSLIIIGHSWGGMVGLNCFIGRSHKISQMILLSPFSRIPDSTTLKPVLEHLCKDFPYLLKAKTINDFLFELNHLKDKNIVDAISKTTYQTKIKIFQATDDEEVPLTDTYELVKAFKNDISFELIKTDHSFTINRDLLFTKCLNQIRGRLNDH